PSDLSSLLPQRMVQRKTCGSTSSHLASFGPSKPQRASLAPVSLLQSLARNSLRATHVLTARPHTSPTAPSILVVSASVRAYGRPSGKHVAGAPCSVSPRFQKQK